MPRHRGVQRAVGVSIKSAARNYGLNFLEGQKGKGLTQREADRLAKETVKGARGGGWSGQCARS